MIMIINFLKFMVNMKYAEPLHLLYLGGAIALGGLALKFSHGEDIETSNMKERLDKIKLKKGKKKEEESPDA